MVASCVNFSFSTSCTVSTRSSSLFSLYIQYSTLWLLQYLPLDPLSFSRLSAPLSLSPFPSLAQFVSLILCCLNESKEQLAELEVQDQELFRREQELLEQLAELQQQIEEIQQFVFFGREYPLLTVDSSFLLYLLDKWKLFSGRFKYWKSKRDSCRSSCKGLSKDSLNCHRSVYLT